MADPAIFADPLVTAEKHPFQIDGFKSRHGAYELVQTGFQGFILRIDMPGVRRENIKVFKNTEEMRISFGAEALPDPDFPFDNSGRKYTGFLQVSEDPTPMPAKFVPRYGCFFLICPDVSATLYFMPRPGEGRRFPALAPTAKEELERGEQSEDEDSSEKSVMDERAIQQSYLEGAILPGSSGKAKPFKQRKGSKKSKKSKKKSKKPRPPKTSGLAAQKSVDEHEEEEEEVPCESESNDDYLDEILDEVDAMNMEESTQAITSSQAVEGLNVSVNEADEETLGPTESVNEGEGTLVEKAVRQTEDYHCEHLGAVVVKGHRICFLCGLFELVPPEPTPAPVSSEKPTHGAEGSLKSELPEGSSGKSADVAEVEQSNADAVDIEGAEKTEQVEDSSGKTIDTAEDPAETKGENSSSSKKKKKKRSRKSRKSGTSSNQDVQGSTECEEGQGPSQKSADNAEGSSVKPEQAENPIDKPVDETQGSEKTEVSEKPTPSPPPLDDEAWVIACIKRNILNLDVPVPQACTSEEASPAEQTSHEAPEILIGSVKRCSVHPPECECQKCDSDGACMKIWSTSDEVIGRINRLWVRGAEGVCEKRMVVDEGGEHWVYVRADLPGLAPDLLVTLARNSCLLFYGKPQKVEIMGLRNYLFFVKLKCSCCKFNQLTVEFRNDGVLRLCCKIIPRNAAAPSGQ